MVSEEKLTDSMNQIKGFMLNQYQEACRYGLVFYDNSDLERYYKARAKAYEEMYVMLSNNLFDEIMYGDDDE